MYVSICILLVICKKWRFIGLVALGLHVHRRFELCVRAATPRHVPCMYRYGFSHLFGPAMNISLWRVLSCITVPFIRHAVSLLCRLWTLLEQGLLHKDDAMVAQQETARRDAAAVCTITVIIPVWIRLRQPEETMPTVPSSNSMSLIIFLHPEPFAGLPRACILKEIEREKNACVNGSKQEASWKVTFMIRISLHVTMLFNSLPNGRLKALLTK